MNNQGVVVVGRRNSGKSTFLFEKFFEHYSNGDRILVIDSATEHTDKSLLRKIYSYYENEALWISSCEKSEITFPNCSKNDYPTMFVYDKINRYSIFLADVSKYLESGYDYPLGEERQKERSFYQKLSMQIIQQLFDKIDVIIMDEIELLPNARFVFEMALSRGIIIYDALHEDSSLLGLDGLFNVIRIDK